MKTFSLPHRYNRCKCYTKGGDFITNEEYFSYLIDTYGNLVYSICYKTCGNPFDAEDLTQEVFLSAYRHLEDFDRAYEKAWLCKIASRKCLDFLKHSSRRVLPTEDCYIELVPVHNSSLEEQVIEKDTSRQLLLACQHLKPPYDEIARLHFHEELTAKEIAQKTGNNQKTIQTQIYRAKAMLRKALQKDYATQERRSP